MSEYTVGAQVNALKASVGAHAESGHRLVRHTFLTRAGDKIKNVKTLMLIAGHNKPATSMRYIHPAGDDIDALAACDGVSNTKKVLTAKTICPHCAKGIAERQDSPQIPANSKLTDISELAVTAS